MATSNAVLRTPTACFSTVAAGGSSLKSLYFHHVSFTSSRFPVLRYHRIHHSSYNSSSVKLPDRSLKFLSFAVDGETFEVDTENLEKETISKSVIEQESTDSAIAIGVDSSSESDDGVAEEPPSSLILSYLSLYKEALANSDDAKVSEVESFLKSVENQKIDLERKMASLSEELTIEKVRILRISADFDNFRKRTERERVSLVTNAQGEVVESLLPVMDNFERAKAQIKVQTEGEKKISNSYQSIYKQFVEILGSLGVVPVETVGKPFDPMVSFRVGTRFSRVNELFEKLYKVYSANSMHEAIMREDSAEYEHGIVIEEYRKGFQLGDILLRPSMVKMSSGPGPAKPEPEEPFKEVEETSEEGSAEATHVA